MNNPIEKLAALKKQTLTTAERTEMRDALVAFMEANPVVSAAENNVQHSHSDDFVNVEHLQHHRSEEMNDKNHSFRSSLGVVRNPAVARHQVYAGVDTSATAFNTIKRKRMISAILFAMFVLSGGVSYAAEGSLPGDALYPVKININEEVRSSLAIGARADAEFARKQLERRAGEAETLEKENRLSGEEKASLILSTEAHLRASALADVRMREEKGGEHNAENARAQMMQTIGSHEAIFLKLGVIANSDKQMGVGSEDNTEVNIHKEDNARIYVPIFDEMLRGESGTSVSVQGESTSSAKVHNDTADTYEDEDTRDGEGTTGTMQINIESELEVKTPTIPKLESEIHSQVGGSGSSNINLGL